MRCRPTLLRVLVALPLLGLVGYGLHFAWQGEPGQQVRDYMERRRAKAEAARRMDRHRADTGVVGDLANGRVRSGGSLAELVARHRPTEVRHYGTFTEVFYDFPDHVFLVLNARDGRLVDAQWMQESGKQVPPRPNLHDEFFRMSPADQTRWLAERKAVVQARGDARMAVAGPAAYIAFHAPLSLTPRP